MALFKSYLSLPEGNPLTKRDYPETIQMGPGDFELKE